MARPHGAVSLVSITTDSARRVGEKAPIAPKTIAVSTSSSGPGSRCPSAGVATVRRSANRIDPPGGSSGRRVRLADGKAAERIRAVGLRLDRDRADAREDWPPRRGRRSHRSRTRASPGCPTPARRARFAVQSAASTCHRDRRPAARGIAGRAHLSPASDPAQSPGSSDRRPRPGAAPRPGAGTTDAGRSPPASVRRRGFAADTPGASVGPGQARRSGSPRRPMASRPRLRRMRALRWIAPTSGPTRRAREWPCHPGSLPPGRPLDPRARSIPTRLDCTTAT